jgi:riboflavin synthase
MSHLATWALKKSLGLRPLTSNFNATTSEFYASSDRRRRSPRRAARKKSLRFICLICVFCGGNMFTGLIEEVGSVRWIRRSAQGTQLQIAAPVIAAGLRAGESVSVNGSCLTATAIHDGGLTFDLLEETLARTNLRTLRPESGVNLERALAADGRLGGHFVQGHIDCTGRVLAFEASGTDYRLEVELPGGFAQYAAYKGSIALNGISLTIAELLPASFAVWIIPHTRRATNLAGLQPNDLLNIEFDLIAKYVERMLPRMIGEVRASD